jgi:hypothetical protein
MRSCPRERAPGRLYDTDRSGGMPTEGIRAKGTKQISLFRLKFLGFRFFVLPTTMKGPFGMAPWLFSILSSD